MGSKWTVMAWVPDTNVTIGFVWTDVYRGSNVVRALLAAVQAKRSGCAAVEVQWR